MEKRALPCHKWPEKRSDQRVLVPTCSNFFLNAQRRILVFCLEGSEGRTVFVSFGGAVPLELVGRAWSGWHSAVGIGGESLVWVSLCGCHWC